MKEINNIELFDLNNKGYFFKYHSYFNQFRDMKPWLLINEKEWSYIKENIEEDVVKDSLTVLLSTYPFPYKEITLEETIEDFNKLKNLDIYKMTTDAEWFSRSSINKDFTDLILSGSNSGNKASNYFQQENRMKTELENSPSQWRCWTTPNFTRTLINSFYTLKLKEITDATIRGALALRKGVASQFKPSIAKYIYDTYNSENILDFSGGWGDRLCGFYASKFGKNFLSIDPNENVHKGYDKQIELYSQLCGDNRKAKTIIGCAEDVDLSKFKDKFDTVFTSPPYFNREKYENQNENQSWFKFKAIEDWLDNFLFKTISNIEPCIKSGGVLIINISDVCSTSKGRKGKGMLEICNPMLDYVDSLDKFHLESIIGYKMSKKPNLKLLGTGVINNGVGVEKFNQDVAFGEPVFIWRKK